MQIFHDKIGLNSYEFGLEIYEGNNKSAGLYKCMVKNDYGQLQVNLNLNIEAESGLLSPTGNTIKTFEFPQEPKKIEKKKVVKVQVQEEGPQVSSEELKQRDKEAMLQAEVDREHEEQMKQLREKKRKEKEPPPPPKTITVMAGSRNRPAWPIAPGIANANQPRQITLVSGEDEKEWEQNRMQVAEAAGLKHVDVTVGEQADIYGQGHQGDYAWSGSLRPTSHKLAKGRSGKPQEDGVS